MGRRRTSGITADNLYDEHLRELRREGLIE